MIAFAVFCSHCLSLLGCAYGLCRPLFLRVADELAAFWGCATVLDGCFPFFGACCGGGESPSLVSLSHSSLKRRVARQSVWRTLDTLMPSMDAISASLYPCSWCRVKTARSCSERRILVRSIAS